MKQKSYRCHNRRPSSIARTAASNMCEIAASPSALADAPEMMRADAASQPGGRTRVACTDTAGLMQLRVAGFNFLRLETCQRAIVDACSGLRAARLPILPGWGITALQHMTTWPLQTCLGFQGFCDTYQMLMMDFARCICICTCHPAMCWFVT